MFVGFPPHRSGERRRWIDALAPVSGFGDGWMDVWGLKVTLDGGVEGGYFSQIWALRNLDQVQQPETSE